MILCCDSTRRTRSLHSSRTWAPSPVCFMPGSTRRSVDMATAVTNTVVEVLPVFEGYVYPNEPNLHPLWSPLIVLYPYITGLVAGAFIMASLVRVFNVRAL